MDGVVGQQNSLVLGAGFDDGDGRQHGEQQKRGAGGEEQLLHVWLERTSSSRARLNKRSSITCRCAMAHGTADEYLSTYRYVPVYIGAAWPSYGRGRIITTTKI
eukprot:SAG31_NODE_202_length_20512_cov_62.659237_9_plen_104_part_00